MSVYKIQEVLAHHDVQDTVLPLQLTVKPIQLMGGIHSRGHLVHNGIHPLRTSLQQFPAGHDALHPIGVQLLFSVQELPHEFLLLVPILVRDTRHLCNSRGSTRRSLDLVPRLHLGVRHVHEQRIQTIPQLALNLRGGGEGHRLGLRLQQVQDRGRGGRILWGTKRVQSGIPRGFPRHTPASARHTESTVTGGGREWNGTPPFLVISYSRRPVTLLPMSCMVPTTDGIVSLSTPFSLRLPFLWILFPPFRHSHSPLLRMLAPPSLILLSLILPVHPPSLLIRLQSCPFSPPLDRHFLRVVFPPSLFLFSQPLSVGLIPLSFPRSRLLRVSLSSPSLLFSHFLWVSLSLPSSLFSIFLSIELSPSSFLFPISLSVVLSPSLFLFPISLSVFLHPLSFLFSRFLPPISSLFIHSLPVFLPPFSLVFPHLLPVGFLPRPVSFQLSAFRCLYPLRLLPSSFGTPPTLDVTCHSLPPLKSLERHLTLIVGQRRQYDTQLSNTFLFLGSFSSSGNQCLSILFPPTFLKLATLLWILVRHRDQMTHASSNTLAIFIDPLDQSATSTQTLPTPPFRWGVPPPPHPFGTPKAPT